MEYTVAELEQERWKPIFGYDGAYQVSDLGRVRSKKYGRWKVMRQKKIGSGYLSITLSKDGKQEYFYVHRLVASAFIENDNIFNTEVNHRNEVKTDNRASNLEWCDRQYNNTYNDIRYRQYHPKPKRNKIKSIYNQNLSTKQNLEIFKANGIECCDRTIWQLRKDLKLKRVRHNWKRDEIRHLYNHNLSIAQNLELFKANGIECSKSTVYLLRKELGITKNINVRDEIRHLYRSDLSIAQNLELLKEQGVECSIATLYRIRKELG